MRIGLQTWGSEGDIRPFLALGAELASRGHEVRLVLTELDERDYSRFAPELGIEIRIAASPLLSSVAEMTSAGEAMLGMRSAFRQGRYIARRLFEPSVPAMLEAGRELAASSDILVRHFFHYPAAVAAELEDVPQISMSFSPDAIPSAEQPPADLPDWGRALNRASWKLAEWVLDRTFLPPVNRLRRVHGLAPKPGTFQSWYADALNLLAVSPTLRPRSYDWAARHEVCGFLGFHDAARFDPLPDYVEHFLESGPAPVFIGFGSLTPKDARYRDEALEVFRHALRAARRRGIVQGLGEPGSADGQILHAGRLPHAEVFPRCAAVVHHAGAGTTQTAVAAGVPSVCVPHLADQFYWSRRLHQLGIAAPPLNRRALTGQGLAERVIVACEQPELRRRAASLGKLARRENGPARAATLIETVRA